MKKAFIVLILIVAAIFAFTFFNRQEAIVQAAWVGAAIQAVPGSVVVKAEAEMPLLSEVGGRVVTSKLEPGAVFREGDIVMQLDPEALELEIARVEAERAAARRRLALEGCAAE